MSQVDQEPSVRSKTNAVNDGRGNNELRNRISRVGWSPTLYWPLSGQCGPSETSVLYNQRRESTMNQNAYIPRDPCNCGKPEGKHGAWCGSNNVGEVYRCKDCNKPTPQIMLAYGLCPDCLNGYMEIYGANFVSSTVNLKEAFKQSFIGTFAKVTLEYMPDVSYDPDTTKTQVNPGQVKITAYCVITFTYLHAGQSRVESMLYSQQGIYNAIALENEGFCKSVAKEYSHVFLMKIPDMKREIEENYGVLTSATFKVVDI